MKLFTKITLGIAGFFFSVALICLVVALSMGVKATDVMHMVQNGVFSFGPEDGFFIEILDDNDADWDEDESEKEISHVCTVLNVKLDAGDVDILYGDVSNVQIKQKNIPGFSITSSEIDKSLKVEGDVGVFHDTEASLTIILPREVKMDAVYLEIGACKVEVSDIVADEFSLVVGAGLATVSDLSVGKLQVEVGAGEAIITNLSVEDLDVDAGVGAVEIEINGAETDYNYDVTCGIGEVTIGDHSYGGMGTTQSISNVGANHQIKIDCGVGEVNMRFITSHHENH